VKKIIRAYEQEDAAAKEAESKSPEPENFSGKESGN
jgi:hypothetical protein